MDTFEKYIKSVLVETEQEDAMDRIICDVFNESETHIAGRTDGSYTSTNTYFVFDPFPFLLFDTSNNSLSKMMIDYYKQAIDDYNVNKNSFRNLKVLPSFIRDTLQCTTFSLFTKAYIENGLADNIGGIEVIKQFYELKPDEVDGSFYAKVGSWHKLKDTIEKNPGDRLFTPADSVTGTTYKRINSSNVAFARGVYMQYDTKTLPVMQSLLDQSNVFNSIKGSLSTDLKPSNEYEKYIGYMLAACANNKKEVVSEIEKVKSKKSFKTEKANLNKKFDRENYKNNRLNKQPTDIDYWQDSTVGDAVKWLNSNANGDPNGEGKAWANTVKDMKHIFNRTTLDKDLEKAYNIKDFIPDVLGMETDDSKYDSRKYEDPSRRKIKGVSGYDIYKHDKKIQELHDEIEEMEKQIALENDASKIKKLQRKIDNNNEEIEIIKQKLDSDEFKGELYHKKYLKKVDNAKSEEVTNDDISKGINYIKSNGTKMSIIYKNLTNQ